MAQYRIKLSANDKGEVTVSVEGLSGTSCKDVTKAIEQALGNVTKDVPTDEMYRTEEQETIIQER